MEIKGQLMSEDSGRDSTSVQNLTKKHQLIKANILSQEDHMSDPNEQVEPLIRSKQLTPGTFRRTGLDSMRGSRASNSYRRGDRLMGDNTPQQVSRDTGDR